MEGIVYRKKQGFTLVELLMVMGIIALMLSLGVPIYSAMTMSRSIGGSAELINGAFLKYRSKATASGKPIFLMFEHWHMNPDSGVDFDKLTPPKLQAYIVEENDEVEGGMDVLEIDDPITLPKGTWFHNKWVTDELQTMSSVDKEIPFANKAQAVIDYYNLDSMSNSWARKVYLVIFEPNGHLEIIGRNNIPGYELEDPDNPDADIWLTNNEDTMLIDINPSTGRTRNLRINNNDYEQFIITY